MGVLLMFAALCVLLATAVSKGRELREWRNLDEPTKARQSLIKEADKAIRTAEKKHRARVAAATKRLSEAERPRLQRKYGPLELFDDRVRAGQQEFALTPKTKARVHKRGRGDERAVMVIVEDINWPHSASATKLGKEHEFEAERFAADVRVLGPKAAQARARRAEEVMRARQDAELASDPSDLNEARHARAALGARLSATGPPPGTGWRRVAVPASLVAFFIGGALTPSNDTPPTATVDAAPAPQASTPGRAPSTSPDPRKLVIEAKALADEGNYAAAQRLVTDLPKPDRSTVRAYASDRAARVAMNALRRRDLAAALAALRRAEGLPRTDALGLAWDRYYSAKDQQQAKRDRQRAAQERTAAEAEESVADYVGLSCDEIGQSFSVSPGSDPEHDRDGDGVACESQ